MITPWAVMVLARARIVAGRFEVYIAAEEYFKMRWMKFFVNEGQSAFICVFT